MKPLFALLLSSLCSVAAADELSSQAAPAPVEPYRYTVPLDIAHVVSHPEIPAGCEVVPVRMTYDDSQGRRHTLEYLVMATGCTN